MFSFTALNRGHLDNGGETITLKDPFENVVAEITYDDESPWVTAADGEGKSLVRVNLITGNSEAANWIESVDEGGSPGTVAPVEVDPEKDSDSDGLLRCL